MKKNKQKFLAKLVKLDAKQKVFLKILVLVFLAILLPLVVLAVLKDKLLTTYNPEVLQAQGSPQASLTLEPEVINPNPGDEFDISILLDTDGETVSAVDALILFDPTSLDFVSAQEGTIEEFLYYPLLGEVSSQDSLNVISLSAIDFNPETSQFSDGYNTSGGNPGLLATLRFRAKDLPQGESFVTTHLSFSFTVSSTTDCNVIQKDTAEDILANVNETNVNILSPSIEASLFLNPTSFALNSREKFEVNILLDTNNEPVSAVDARVLFDPAVLSFVKAEEGTIFSYYPLLGKLSTEDGMSLVSVSAVNFNPQDTSFYDEFTSQAVPGLLATLTFKTKTVTSPTTTTLAFKFTTSLANDSNVVRAVDGGAIDILKVVNQATVSISPLPPSPPLSPPPSPSLMPSPSIIPSASPATPARLIEVIEAESGSLAGAMQKLSDSTASEGEYISPTGSGTATYQFTTPKEAHYFLWMRVNTKNGKTNSFYAKFDSGNRLAVHLPVTHESWRWQKVSLKESLLDFRKSAHLTKGIHLLEISNREENTKLDKLIISDDPGLNPSSVAYLSTSSPLPSPLPSPSPSPSPSLQPNLVLNPGFENGQTPWQSYSDVGGGYGEGLTITNSTSYQGSYSALFYIDASGGNNIQLYQANINAEPNTNYELSFAAKSNTGCDLKADLLKHTELYDNYGLSQEFNLTSSWQIFTTEFTTNYLASSDARFRFWFVGNGQAGDQYFIDQVSLTKIE